MNGKCQHRRFTGESTESGNYILRCKNCGLRTTTEYKDLTEAVLRRRADFADAAAEIAARKQRAREVRA